MASLYKNNQTWYISVSYDGNRICQSLKTKDYRLALKLKTITEYQIISRLIGKTIPNKSLNFKELVNRFMKAKTNWAPATLQLNKYILNSYLEGKPLPINPTSRAIHIRHINQCWNWGLKHNLVIKAHKIPGDIKGESRSRTFSDDELDLMFKNIKDHSFNAFVHFAYYTGARSGEIRSIPKENHLGDCILVKGKTGRRYVKLNNQSQSILKNQNKLWNYSKDYVSKRFKKEVRRLGIKNARFHDLRRTFGLNLIKQGMSIYKVSKLLGHKSVRTTETHYAPLLTVEIEDFTL